jgi:Uma2 family endonuclease
MEFCDGAAYAMAGGTPTHAQLAAQISGLLFMLVRGGGGRCRVYSSDAKVHIESTGNSYYPDVTVACGPHVPSARDPNALSNPTVIVEVVSPTTESFDRGRKFADYRRLQSLSDYLVVSQDREAIDHFHRNADGTWAIRTALAGDVVKLDVLEGELRVVEIYAGVDLAG